MVMVRVRVAVAFVAYSNKKGKNPGKKSLKNQPNT